MTQHQTRLLRLKAYKWLTKHIWAIGAMIVIVPIAYVLNDLIAASTGYIASKLLVDIIDYA